MMRRVMAALLVTCAVLVVVVRAQNPADTSTPKPADAAEIAKKLEEDLKDAQRKQAKMEAQFKDFASALRRLKQRLEQSPKAEDRQRATELGKALELAEKENVTTKFESLVESLKRSKTTDPDALESILRKNEELGADIRAILSALTARNPDEELRKEKERIQELLKRLNELIRAEQTLRAWTERGMDKKTLGPRQGDVAKDTEKFGKALSKDGNPDKPGEQAKSNPKGEGTKKDGGDKAEGKDDTKDKKGDGKDQEGKPGDKKPGDGDKKPGDGDSKGEGKPPEDNKENPGGSKGEGKPMEGQEPKSGGKGESKPMEGENKGGSKGGDPKDGNQENKGGSKGNGEDKKPGNETPKPGDKDSKPGEGKGEPKPGSPMGGDPKENKGGSKGDGNPMGKPMGEQKPGDSKGGKPSDGKPGEGKPGQGGESKGKGEGKGEGKGQPGQPGQPSPMPPMPPKDSKPGESKGGQGGGMGQPGQGESKGGGGGGGGGPPPPPQPPQPPKEGYPGRKQVEDAQKSMEEAKKKIEEDKDAGKDQDKAIEDLKQAQKKLEELLRQLREEEIERLLAALQARCERMLAMQKEVYVGTVDTHKVIEAHADKKPTRAEGIRSIGLADRESEIVSEANKAIVLLEQEGTAVAFAEVFHQVRGDMMNVEKRLRTTDVGRITQTIEEDIIATLGEMIDALKKAQKDQQAKKQPPKPGQPPQSGPKPNDPLLDMLAELKMVRSMQLRVNNRTKTYGQEYPLLEQTPAIDPALPVEQKAKLEQIHKEFTDLSDRQEKIVDIVKNLSKGKGPER